MVKAFSTLAVLVCLAASGSAQVTNDAEQVERNAAMRVARLAALLDPDNPVNVGANFDQQAREKLTEAVREEVTKFVELVIPANSKPEAIQARLRALMVTHQPSQDFGELPKARTATLQHGRSLVLSYTVVRPPHFDSSLIFGFIQDGAGFRQVATTGEDFDHYSMFSYELPSPVNGELWLLAGGRAHTANGLGRYRYRVYSFNGDAFRTIWSRDDVLNAAVAIVPTGFAIKHTDREAYGWPTVTVEYTLSANGIFKVK